MDISVHLSQRYWLSVSALSKKLDYSESCIRSSLKDAVRGGIVVKKIGKSKRHYFKTLNYRLDL